MTTDAAFQQAILANPADVTLRLVYADWLEEQGNPRAELFRLQHALSQSADVPNRPLLEARQQELLDSGVPPAAIITTNSMGMKFSLIRPGEFWMGSPESEDSRSYDEALECVAIARPFFIGVYAVTQGEFSNIMGWNPINFRTAEVMSETGDQVDDAPRYPVERVTWYDAVEFCNRLGRREHLEEHYQIRRIHRTSDGSIERAAVSLNGVSGYRLPTESEWEYACRAGTTTAFYFGSEPQLREAEGRGFARLACSPRKTSRLVGFHLPNPFGLYDMHGNLREWCQPYNRLSAHDRPLDHADESVIAFNRVTRGGSFCDNLDECRSASRNWSLANERLVDLGFRVARTP